MSDPAETALKREITRLRNIAKTKAMTLSEKLAVLGRVKAAEDRLRAYRLGQA